MRRAPDWTIEYEAAGEDPSGGGPAPLCFTPLKGAGSIRVVNEGKSKLYVEYSIDGVKWIPFDPLKPMEIKCGDGQSIYLRGKNPNGLTTDPGIGFFHITTDSPFGVSGDVMSLIDYEKKVTEIPCDYCFYHLFETAEEIYSAPTLSATVLRPHCYEGMFCRCINLKTGPVLPAEYIPEGAYSQMFKGCFILSRVEFGGNKAESGSCFSDWLDGVAEYGTIVIYGKGDPEGILKTGTFSGIPEGWSVASKAVVRMDAGEAGSATAEAK